MRLLTPEERKLYVPGLAVYYARLSSYGLGHNTPAEWCDSMNQGEIVLVLDNTESAQGVIYGEEPLHDAMLSGCMFWGLTREQRLLGAQYAIHVLFSIYPDILRLEGRTAVGNPAGEFVTDLGWTHVGVVPHGMMNGRAPLDMNLYVLTREGFYK